MSQDSEEVIDLKEEVARLKRQLSDAQEERDDYKALFQSKMIRVSNLEAHLSGANGEKELQKNEIGRLNTKIKSLENKLSETEQDRDLYKGHMDYSRSKLQRLTWTKITTEGRDKDGTVTESSVVFERVLPEDLSNQVGSSSSGVRDKSPPSGISLLQADV